MKFIVIGDLHGKSCWRQVDIYNYDKIIFIGDYVDGPETMSDTEIVDNLHALITLKINNPDKIILLLGNHDIHYLHFPLFRGSGLRITIQEKLTHIFQTYANLFQVAYQAGNYLFTHAGVNQLWYNEFLNHPAIYPLIEKGDTLADLLNKIEARFPEQRAMLHKIGAPRGGAGFGGITWADSTELKSAMLMGYHQIVGHSRVFDVKMETLDSSTSVTFIDVLNTRTYFHEIEVFNPHISKIF